MTKKAYSEELTDYKVEQLSNEVDSIRSDVKKILENHLPHIQASVTSLEAKINVMTAINVGAVIIGIIVTNYILK